MLSSFEVGVLTLLRNALKGETQAPPDDFDYNLAYEFAKKHQIIPILYYGGAHIDAFANSEIGTKFLMTTMALASFSENQLTEIEKLTKAFKENGIEFLKLKGTVLKCLYPHPEMRLMSDSDILIKEEQREQIEKLLKELGYHYKTSSDHEIIWGNESITIELHKRLIATYQKDFYAYFGNGWGFAGQVDGTSEYKMSPEDEFVYLFTHLSKHYRDAGIGIKHFTDIYVFLKANPQINMDYIMERLKTLRLDTFFENVKEMLEMWFDEKEVSEKARFITAKVFNSSVYGDRLTEIKAQALKDKKQGKKQSKLGKLFARIFPPYKTMSYMFPVLEKAPILLPFMWVARWFKLIFCRKEKIQKGLKDVNTQVSDQELNELQCELDYVGLDYNFEEKK